ncbi:hypothetical protein GCM10010357_19030 [Streptomyces luteireticuli]|uniref:Uncharacterized protein n=1 Tax=Streptomyces luteireticuli TaxID=173858 RepID=A0ABN0YJY7_9ACTN
MLKYPKARSSYARRSGPGRSALARASRAGIAPPASRPADNSRRPPGPPASGLSMSTTHTRGRTVRTAAGARRQGAE